MKASQNCTGAIFTIASATSTPAAMESSSSTPIASTIDATPPSNDAEVPHERAATVAREVTRVRHTLAGRARDREARVPLAAEPESGEIGAVLDEDRRVDALRHLGQLVDVAREHTGGVTETMLGAHRVVDALVAVAHRHDRIDRHQ